MAISVNIYHSPRRRALFFVRHFRAIFGAVKRSVFPGGPIMEGEPMSNFKTKKADEVVTIGIEYDSDDLESGETISTVAVTVAPVVTGGLAVKGTPAISGNVVSAVVEDGVSGASYVVEFKSTTSAGHVWIDEITVEIE